MLSVAICYYPILSEHFFRALPKEHTVQAEVMKHVYSWYWPLLNSVYSPEYSPQARVGKVHVGPLDVST